MQQDHRGAVGGAGFGVADIQQARVDLLSGANEVLVPGLVAGSVFDFDAPDCACAAPIAPNCAAAIVMAVVTAAVPKKCRR